MVKNEPQIALRTSLDALPMVMIRQRWEQPDITDIEGAANRALSESGALTRIRAGQTVAITAGSRGIKTMPRVLHALVDAVKECGAEPFIFPAMGSHGGATAQGQREMLAGLGVSEETMGCPVRSSMEVTSLGRSRRGMPVVVDSMAMTADGILVVNRIKKHTNFDGAVESGLCKMAVIGMGKHAQAVAVHQYGNDALRDDLQEIAGIVFREAPVLAGVGLIENAWGGLARVVGLHAEEIVDAEPALFSESKSLGGKLPFHDIDVGIVERIGKDISGTGMDCYVIGRRRIIGEPDWPEAPSISSLVVLGLTEASHGNGLGVGLADFCTRRLAQGIDWEVTRANVMTSGNLERAKLPLVLESDRSAIESAAFRERRRPPHELRVVCMPDTLHLRHLYVSCNLAHGEGLGSTWEIVGDEGQLRYGAEGALQSPFGPDAR